MSNRVHSAGARLALALVVAACDCDTALRVADAQLAVDPPELDFGTVAVGAKATRSVILSVRGTGTLALTAAALEGEPVFTSDFREASLAGDATLVVTLTYAPTAAGEHRATWRVSDTQEELGSVKLVGRAAPGCTDADGDTYGAACEPGPDCDDGRPSVHPGAAESCGNGLDDDCNADTSDTCPPSCVDADSDAYGEHCERGPDCEDANASVNPGVAEACGNGLDDDCNPATTDTCPPPCIDADGDGWGVNCRGPDCDDERPSVNPGRPESCGNGLDDDCNAATPDGCIVACGAPGCGVGCADGQREAFTDHAQAPFIAGCGGGFDVPGLFFETPPRCAREAGDDGARPNGEGCSAEDLCAPGWHVCRTAAEVASKSPDGCAGATIAGSFFATRQSGNGCGHCSVSPDPTHLCGGDTCLSSCYPTSEGTNDVFGCGGAGSPLIANSCAPLDRFGHNACGSLPDPWYCGDSTGNDEALRVVKRGPGAGGVLCCVD